MALQTVLEKLHIKDEKNILVQGLPSSIEKQFLKISFAKSVTPLLRSRRIDLAVVFAITKSQLSSILQDVLPAMDAEGKLWVAYPKSTAKIVSDLCRDCHWDCMTSIGFETGEMVELDSTWRAINFIKASQLSTSLIKDVNRVKVMPSIQKRPNGFEKISSVNAISRSASLSVAGSKSRIKRVQKVHLD